MAREILKERGKQWGDPITTHIRIAKVWSAILDVEVQPVHVALCLAGMKLVRASVNPTEPDNYEDIPGYSDIAKMIIGLDSEKLAELRDYLAEEEYYDSREEIAKDLANYTRLGESVILSEEPF